MPPLELKPRLSKDGRLEVIERGWRLGIPAGTARSYRLAQLDDQAGRPRSAYPWNPPLSFSLRARVSAESAPGTWGFGLWNDPYGFSFGPGERFPRLPALPQAAWYFYASPRCYLSFRDDQPASGFYAQVYRSGGFDARLFAAAFALPFAPRTARRFVSRVIDEDAAIAPERTRDWHAYRVDWAKTGSAFYVDSRLVLRTPLSPRGPLGVVVWIDNQYAAFDPQGRIAWGVEANATELWLEVEDLAVEAMSATGSDSS